MQYHQTEGDMPNRPDTLYLRIPEDVQQRLKEWARATGYKLTDLSCVFLKAGLDNPPEMLRDVRALRMEKAAQAAQETRDELVEAVP